MPTLRPRRSLGLVIPEPPSAISELSGTGTKAATALTGSSLGLARNRSGW
jgi:hypothetical protein